MKLFYRDIQIHTNDGRQFSLASSYGVRSVLEILTYLTNLLDNREGTMTVFPYEDCFEIDGSPVQKETYEDYGDFLDDIALQRRVHGLYVNQDLPMGLCILTLEPIDRINTRLSEDNIRTLWEVYGILKAQNRIVGEGFEEVSINIRKL